MKKIFIISFLAIFIFSFANGQFTKIGGGLGFTSGFPFHQMTWDYNKSSKFDGYIKGIYEISLPFHISPSITMLFPHVWKESLATAQQESKVTVNSMMIDVNAHYVFNSLKRFEFYGLGGLDVLLAWKKSVDSYVGSPAYTSKEKDNAIGLNIGVGTYVKIAPEVDLSIEAKYLISKYDQFMLNAGVLVNIYEIHKKKHSGL
jgi:opacity protein-like surface antigen